MGERDQQKGEKAIAVPSADIDDSSEEKSTLFGVPRKVCFGLVALLVISIIAIAVGVLLSKGDDREITAPAVAPSVTPSTAPSAVRPMAPSEITAPAVAPSVTPSTAPSAVRSMTPSVAPSASPSNTPSLSFSPSAVVFVSIGAGGPVNFDDIPTGDPVGDYRGLTWTNLQARETLPSPPSPPRVAFTTNTLVSIESGPGEIFSLVSVDVIGRNIAEPITVRGFDNNGDLVATKGIDASPGSYQTFDLTAFANVKRKDRNNQGWRTRCASLTVLYRWPVIIGVVSWRHPRRFRDRWFSLQRLLDGLMFSKDNWSCLK
eukprot:scaffold2471_cov155-Cylindrotheca_fusiformis.AAC.5